MPTVDLFAEQAAPDNVAVNLAAVLDRISDGFLALDTAWRITYVSEKAARLLDRRRDALLGRLLWDEFPEGVGTEFYGEFQAAVRTQQPRQFEAFSAAHGLWFECHAYPAPTGLSVLFRDVTERRETRQRLEDSEERYRSLYERNLDAVFSFDAAGRFVDANPACEAVSGYTPDELRGTSFLPLVVPEDQARTLASFALALRGQARHERIALRHKSGRRVELTIAKTPIFVAGRVVGVHGIARDITAQVQAEAARSQAEAALRESERSLRAAAAASPVAMMISDWQTSEILYANAHVRGLFGLGPDEEVAGRRAAAFYAVPADRAALQALLVASDHLQSWEGQVRRTDGTTFWAVGAFQRMTYNGREAIFSAYHDASLQKRRLDEALTEADQDPLTGLLNHRSFHRRLAEETERARQTGAPLAVALLDLDNFKFFNDAYGHATGDEVLRRVADALRAACRAGDTVARFGGDEFALLLPEVGGAGAEEITARLRADLGEVRYQPNGSRGAIPLGLSVGVALFPGEAETRLDVMQTADERLLRAKSGEVADTEARRTRSLLRRSVEGFSMVDALVSAVDNKDRYTCRHSEEVLVHALALARHLGLDADAVQTVTVAALLHDVGKIGIPDAILRKPGALTGEEFEAVKRHPSLGAAIVAAVPGLSEILDAVRGHHERWDGGGYPAGLRGEETPLLARLLAVADAYSAMTSDRPYRKGLSPETARRLLAEGAGTQWDPACIAAFLAVQGKATP